ncbi:tetratricopeptide repeat protein [Odoribacter sp. OttesenSCG-928-J03]|nr:tetratricopeptide repeat protein [Odoribacter sp. OttesenSCG-928-J03]MDL2330548.1 tetratricopeptide repeat protein [Odoribacter sp. OttesenSCG-928-A06]
MNTYFNIVVLLLFVACTNKAGVYSNKLAEWDSLLEKNPQEAQAHINAIDPGQLNESETAYYYLLQAIAIIKNHQTIESDSTLKIANEYFNDQHDYYNLSRTQYYQSCYLSSTKNTQEAFEILKQAEAHFKESEVNDPKTIGLIYYQIANISRTQAIHKEAHHYFEKSLEAFKAANDTLSSLFSLRELGALAAYKHEFKEAESYFNEILETIEHLGKENDNRQIIKLHAGTLNSLSYFHRKKGEYSEALKTAKEGVKILEENNLDVATTYYNSITYAYKGLQQIDSLKYYFTKILETHKKKCGLAKVTHAHRFLIDIEEEAGNYKEACRLKDVYIQLKDSLYIENINDRIIELEKKYNYSEQERLLLKSKNKNLWLYISILFIAVITSCLFLYFNWKHQRLKEKNKQLNEKRAEIEWGYNLFKEIAKYHTNYHENLERIINRNISIIPSKVYHELNDSNKAQKNDFSNKLFAALKDIDQDYIEELQEKHPDITPEEVVVAYMLKHQLPPHEIAKIFGTTIEAIKKRTQRLKTKLHLS